MIRYFKENQFLFLVGSFVVVCSFAYGISAGLKKNSALAYAKLNSQFSFQEENFNPLNIALPERVEAVGMGKDVQINGMSAEVFSFYSDESVESVVRGFLDSLNRESVKIIFNTVGQKRALISGISERNKKRYLLNVWAVPSNLQEVSSRGKRTTGMMEITDLTNGFQRQSNESMIPEVPLMTGGKAGAVFSSEDLDRKRSSTTVYTNPGSIQENLDYYSEILKEQGWYLESSPLPQSVNNKIFSNLVFHRNKDELILLLSQSENKTVMNVTKIEAID
ncbi:MAG: hypothetical protein KBC84_02620 [Proteobacteria bacterium]|nr:hypothetical protein [Pseudomonadota bacterium]